MSITICDTHLVRTVRYLSLTFEPVYFSSFSELNTEISIITDELNNREFSKGKGNRKELFDKYDKPALKPLPHESLKPYTYVIKTVPNNYHV